jgi:hypothetical protein
MYGITYRTQPRHAPVQKFKRRRAQGGQWHRATIWRWTQPVIKDNVIFLIVSDPMILQPGR